jgi:low temperature requirement protein LtrA
LSRASPGREQNAIARDSYSFLHLPMIAGIVLGALGLKKTLEHASDPLELVPAVALLGGAALYLLGHVGFRWRNIHRVSWQRLIAAAALVALIPLATELAATLSVAIVLAVLVAVIVYEVVRFAELRDRMRHQLADAGPA